MWAPGVVQTIDLPNVYRRQRQVAQAGITLAERNREVSRASVLRDTRLAYLNLQFAEAQVRQFTAQDSLYRALRLATERLFAAGEVTSLQRISTDAEARQVTVQLQQATDDLRAAQRRLGLLLGQPTATLAGEHRPAPNGPGAGPNGGGPAPGLAPGRQQRPAAQPRPGLRHPGRGPEPVGHQPGAGPAHAGADGGLSESGL